MAVFFSLYSKPAGMPPYAPQGFPFLPPYPPQDTNRSIASVPVAESVPSSYATDKSAAPSYGLIADLPLPVPTTEGLLQVCACGEVCYSSCLLLQPSELVLILDKVAKSEFHIELKGAGWATSLICFAGSNKRRQSFWPWQELLKSN